MKELYILLVSFFVSIVVVNSNNEGEKETFTEELYLKPLPNGDLLAHFSFDITSSNDLQDHDSKDFKDFLTHFDLMPKVVGEFLTDHALEELDISLSRGVWRPKFWGYAPKSAPVGSMVSARFNPTRLKHNELAQARENNKDSVGYKATTAVDKSWRRLTNALSGQFCASLNFLDSTQSVSPVWSLRPSGVKARQESPLEDTDESHFRFGTLPGENVCTENLTPWKKLLPCQAKRGLATLLNARSIHTTKYHSIGLTLRSVCPTQPSNSKTSCQDPIVELRQHVTLVFDPSSFRENVKLSRPRSNSVGQLHLDWSITTLFGMGLNSRCPLAKNSNIYINMLNDDAREQNLFAVDPEIPSEEMDVVRSKEDDKNMFKIRKYDLEHLLDQGVHNLHARYDNQKYFEWNNLNQLGLNTKGFNIISASRHQTGYGQERGGIVTTVRNSGVKDLKVVFLDIVPWFLRVYLHTLKIETTRSSGVTSLDKPLMTKFTPGIDRKKPYSIELVLQIPAQSTVRISIGFEHSILKWHEYPPDANKGFYIGSALVSTLIPASEDKSVMSDYIQNFFGSINNPKIFDKRIFSDDKANVTGTQIEVLNGDAVILLQLYTEALLVNLPTPDFSMPYNVICLACTVVALAFGPLVNITTKSLTIIRVADEIKEAENSLRNRVTRKLKKVFRMSSNENKSNDEPPTTNETENSDDVTKDECEPCTRDNET